MQMHPSSRPFAAWATGLIDKYRYNPFVRTTTHVVLLQVVLAAIKIGVFLWSIAYIQEHTVALISTSIAEAVAAGATTTPTSLPLSIEGLLIDTYVYLLTVLILLNIVFGFLIARFALWPTRNSLQFQKRFIGNVAHEIRTPLAIIKTNTEVALFDKDMPQKARVVFEDTICELDRISETINNLLSFDTLTRPRKMPFEAVDLGDIAETALARHQELAESRGVRLAADIGPYRIVRGNASALEQVATNLVKNAVNYTPEGKDGLVTVSVQPDEDRKRIVLSVKDTGIGIEQKDLYHIFEPFYRGDTSRARNIGTGTSGLGLAIVNEIVRLHKGAIAIRSTPGIGTEIRISLPAHEGIDLPNPHEYGDKGQAHEISLDFSR